MNVWSKMITALKGGANEIGEKIIDDQALRILDQEIRDSAEDLSQTKAALAASIAKQKVFAEQIDDLKGQITKSESAARLALDSDTQDLALELAQLIANKENRITELNEESSEQQEHADQLRRIVRLGEAQLKQLKQQTETIKATESLQRAQQAMARRYSEENPRLRTAVDALERLKQKQETDAAKLEANLDYSERELESDLDRKLREAGISNDSSANKVLERLKNKK